MRTKHASALIASSLLTLAVACGSSTNDAGEFPGSSSGTSGTSGTSSGSSGFGTSGGTSGGDDGGGSCAAVSAETAKAKVDIIFVIDNSGSMTEEMKQIRANVNTFASKIGTTGLDYTVTFIVRKGTNANQNQICVPAPLAGANCADNPPTFHHVDTNVQSNDSFDLILSTYETSWKNYLRPDATKAFVEVTDDTSKMRYGDFDTQLLAKQPPGMFGTAAARNYIWHSIVSKPFADPIPSTNTCLGSAGPSVDYQQLSKLTGGIVDEVCKIDYSGVLDNIAKGIADKLACTLTYPKAEAEDPTKVVVTVTPMGGASQPLNQVTDVSKCDANPSSWYYDDNTNPTKILLCPSTCTSVNATANQKVSALVGCKGAPPK